MDDKDYIELQKSEEGDSFEYRSFKQRSEKPIPAWKAKLVFWSILIGGIAVGTLLFLTFISLFVYFFVPIVVLVCIWYVIRSLTK